MNIDLTAKIAHVELTPAERVLRQATELAERAEALSDCLASRLASVCQPALPEDPYDKKANEAEENFPPLFHELRYKLRCVEDRLTCIDRVLGRLGL